MKRSMKSKRVSWASNLCQVAFFRKEDSPSRVGLSKEHLPIATSHSSYYSAIQSDDLPPGFGAPLSKVPGIPFIKWSCPPKFAGNPKWLVAAGEESREAGAQCPRESKVLESVYPYSSSIPSSPSISAEAQAERYNDNLTPTIPIIPIEELETSDAQTLLDFPPFAAEALKISKPQLPLPRIPPPHKPSPTMAGPDVAAAAASAASAILLKAAEQGSMIDMNLLIKILNNPKMVEELMKKSHGEPKSNLTVLLASPDINTTKLNPPQAAFIPPYGSGLVKNPIPIPVPIQPPIPVSREILAPKTPIPFPQTKKTTIVPVRVSTGLAVTKQQQPTKGIDYYKNLIRQHGGEMATRENTDQTYQNRNQNVLENLILSHHEKVKPPRETGFAPKHKKRKHCVFYNSPKGCRNGSKCPFQHVSIPPPSPWQTGNFIDEPNAKRIRLGGEIMGR